MLPVVRTRRAELDFDEIVDYLDQHSAGAADRFALALHAKCRLLSRFPKLGRARDELHPGLRSVLVGKYLVFYRLTDTSLVILRILHGRRDQAAIDWEPDDE